MGEEWPAVMIPEDNEKIWTKKGILLQESRRIE